MSRILLGNNSTCHYNFILQSAPVCYGNLVFLDNYTGERVMMECSDLTIMEDTISFAATRLTANRHYHVTVTASNVAGSDNSSTMISEFSDKMVAIVVNY